MRPVNVDVAEGNRQIFSLEWSHCQADVENIASLVAETGISPCPLRDISCFPLGKVERPDVGGNDLRCPKLFKGRHDGGRISIRIEVDRLDWRPVNSIAEAEDIAPIGECLRPDMTVHRELAKRKRQRHMP